MKLHTMLPAIACALCFGFAAGQEAGAADQAMPPMGGMQGGMDMSKAGQASFDKMDADKDGKVSPSRNEARSLCPHRQERRQGHHL